MKTLFVYNSHSGNYSQKLKDVIIKKLSLLSASIVEINVYSEDIALDKSYDLVCIAGGDGTINNVVKEIFKNQLQNKIKLIIIPLGSANVLANSLNLSKSFVLKNWKNLKEVKIEVGEINSRIFLSASSLGTMSDIINNTKHVHKNFFGFGAYLFKMLLNWRMPTKTFRLIIDERVFDVTAHSVIFAIGLNIVGFRSIQKKPDGLVDIYLLKNKTALGFITVLFHFIFNKSGFSLERFSAKTVSCEVKDLQSLQIDGEKQSPENIVTAKIIDQLTVLV